MHLSIPLLNVVASSCFPRDSFVLQHVDCCKECVVHYHKRIHQVSLELVCLSSPSFLIVSCLRQNPRLATSFTFTYGLFSTSFGITAPPVVAWSFCVNDAELSGAQPQHQSPRNPESCHKHCQQQCWRRCFGCVSFQFIVSDEVVCLPD